jgi:hypothetical protein
VSDRVLLKLQKMAGEIVDKISRGEYTAEDDKRLRRYLALLEKRISELEYKAKQLRHERRRVK